MRSVVLVFCLLSSLFCHAAGGRALVRLCERAGVRAETIRLSDFLPPEAAAIQKEAAAIELGRRPLLGSPRYFTRQEIEQVLRSHKDLSAQFSIPEGITAFTLEWPISSDLVQRAISDYAVSHAANPRQFDGPLKLLGGPAASQPAPGLKIERVESDVVRDEVRFTVRCIRRNECGVFLATMRQPKLLSATLLGGTQVKAIVSSSITKQALVHVGTSAMLNLHNNSVVISMRVICLDRGFLGQTIRVRDGRNVFKATVVGAAAVEANL